MGERLEKPTIPWGTRTGTETMRVLKSWRLWILDSPQRKISREIWGIMDSTSQTAGLEGYDTNHCPVLRVEDPNTLSLWKSYNT
jgi:hypothetical protein